VTMPKVTHKNTPESEAYLQKWVQTEQTLNRVLATVLILLATSGLLRAPNSAVVSVETALGTIELDVPLTVRLLDFVLPAVAALSAAVLLWWSLRQEHIHNQIRRIIRQRAGRLRWLGLAQVLFGLLLAGDSVTPLNIVALFIALLFVGAGTWQVWRSYKIQEYEKVVQI